jgi:peptidoglycan hydrolase-like protein with peptidoglycan-binding domain
MKRAFLFLTMLCLGMHSWADEQTQAVQQALKDGGFYYSAVDGQPGPETDAAVRRYQIRQGLDVTGKLDAETLAALNLGGSAKSDNTVEAVPPPSDSTDAQPAESQATPQSRVVQSDHDFLRNQPPAATPAPDDEVAPQPPERVEPAEPVQPTEPMQPPDQAQQAPPDAGRAPAPEYADFFRKTPYEIAPAVVQQTTVRSAQMRLGRQGFYRGYADGGLSKSFSQAVAGYQRDVDLRVTGRLDMETLASLNLLPQRREVVRPPMPDAPPPPQGVYRGIWVH